MTAARDLLSLTGRTALVTGGSGILGRELARGLAEAGADVWIAGRSQERLDEAIAQIAEAGCEVRGLSVDVRDPDSVLGALNSIREAGGDVDVLVNGAGGNSADATAMPGERSFFDLDFAALREVVDLNLFGGAIIPCSIVGRAMVESGRPGSIINITSVAADRPISRVAGYGVAKAGAANLTLWLATHLARDLGSAVRVNAIMPGFFLTEQNRFLLLDAEGKLTTRGETILAHTPMGRFGRPEDLIGACLFLASDASSFVTGTTLVVDGGFTGFSGV